MPIYETDGSQPRLRLPRLGVIRLGIKVPARNGGERPQQSEHFVLNDDEKDRCGPVRKVYEEEPTELIIMFPGEDEEVVSSHWMRSYSQTHGLVCIGNGITANRTIAKPNKDGELKLGEDGRPLVANRDDRDNTMKYEVACRCPRLESGDCRATMYLRFFLPDVPGMGIWQMNIQGKNSILNLQGAMEILRLQRGGISGIRLKLSYLPASIPRPGGGFQTKRVLSLDTETPMTLPQLQASSKDIMALMPAIDLPDEKETPPEDAEQNEEEAEYLNKQQMSDAGPPDASTSIEDQARAAGHTVVNAGPAEATRQGNDSPETPPPQEPSDEEPPPPPAPQDPPSDGPPATTQSGLNAEQQETLSNAPTKPLTASQERKLSEVRTLCEELGVTSTVVVEYIANTFMPKEGSPPRIWELKAPQTKMLLDWLRLEFGAPVSQETSDASETATDETPETVQAAAADTAQAAAAATIAEADQANADKEPERQAGFGF